jgi:hypothetical protein
MVILKKKKRGRAKWELEKKNVTMVIIFKEEKQEKHRK